MVSVLKSLCFSNTLLLFLATTTSASQQVLGKPNTRTNPTPPSTARYNPYASFKSQEYQLSYDDGLFTPLEDFSVLSANEFTSLSHPAFPAHGVRIKKTTLCDQGVNSYTGYIDVEARHLFFYFFESRNDPNKDDVIFWTNGGEFCLCQDAMCSDNEFLRPWLLFFPCGLHGARPDAGPCRVNDANGTKYFNEAWNSNANVFFVDQPIGVGYSYADYGEQVGTSEDAATDIAAFVAIFFEHFSKFKGRAFHMAGESYGGRYIPLFAAEVYDQNARLVDAGLTPINLASAIIGIGSNYRSRCEKWLKESCTDTYDKINCRAAFEFCQGEFSAPFYDSGKNPYDISKDCEGGPSDLCYPVTGYATIHSFTDEKTNTATRHISRFLNSTDTRSLLGVDPAVPSPYSMCSGPVSAAFAESDDQQQPATPFHIEALLERGVRVLIYVGTYDWICNWVGNERWTRNLEWTGHREFAAQDLRVWEAEGKRAGLTRSAKGLTFATIEAAGHMVPYDKPKEALTLINRWLANEEL
ncbi:hypothetical protein DXG01_002062 [Tephrocybe rancida]|nr:hypothetical protein DXG01_002062 [Tephrocybe rancida]